MIEAPGCAASRAASIHKNIKTCWVRRVADTNIEYTQKKPSLMLIIVCYLWSVVSYVIDVCIIYTDGELLNVGGVSMQAPAARLFLIWLSILVRLLIPAISTAVYLSGADMVKDGESTEYQSQQTKDTEAQ